MAAAYVASETLTVEEFFLRGAAIGLQRLSIGPRTSKSFDELMWDDWGPLLLDGVNPTPVCTDDRMQPYLPFRFSLGCLETWLFLFQT